MQNKRPGGAYWWDAETTQYTTEPTWRLFA